MIVSILKRRRRIPSSVEGVLFLAALSTAKCNTRQQEPTRVPGSEHLVVQTHFPYEYWHATEGPYTPTVPPSPTSTQASYGFFYGESSADNPSLEPSSWHMLPIQLPDDLVGDVNERYTKRTTTSAPTYPTTATPQYGRYPGVTEQPHLFHPERLYPNIDNYNKDWHQKHGQALSRPKYSHRPSNSKGVTPSSHDTGQSQVSQGTKSPKKPQSSWQQGLLNQMEPFVSTNLPQLLKFSNLPGIQSLPKFPPWFYDIIHDNDQSKISSNKETDITYSNKNGSPPPHQFFPLPDTSLKPYRKHQFPTDNQQAENNYHKTPHENSSPNDDQKFYEKHDVHQYPKNRLRPFNRRRRPYPYRRRRPLRRNQFKNHLEYRPQFPESSEQDPWDAQLFTEDNSNNEQAYQSGSNIGLTNPPTGNIHPMQNHFRPNRPGRRPFRRLRPRPNQILGQNSLYDLTLPNSQIPQNPQQATPVRPRWPKPSPTLPTSQAVDTDHSGELIDRITGTSEVASSVAIPGGMLIVAMALALFYFNFVWYPTPVVTARLIKLLSDSAPNNMLDSEKQQKIGEVYEVFRSLETEFMQDQSLWQPSCKSRLVCQVHQEIPGLWQVTDAYEAVVRRSLATGPKGEDELGTFLDAAQKGNQGSNCIHSYQSCQLTPVPVRDYLQKLLGIVDSEILPTVVYS